MLGIEPQDAFDCRSGMSNLTGTPFYKTDGGKGPSININVHRNPYNVRKGGGGKCLVRILLLTKTLNISIIQA